MRVDPTSAVARAGRVQLDRPATMRDPSRAPLDVRVRDLSATGALLEAEGELPVGTLVSLGIAGAGMQLARVVRGTPGGMCIEFMLPLDAQALAAAGRVDTLVSVAFPQMPVQRATPSPWPEPVESRVAPSDVPRTVRIGPERANRSVAAQLLMAAIVAAALLIYLVL